MGNIVLEQTALSLWRARAYMPNRTSHTVVRRTRQEALNDIRFQLKCEFADIDSWPIDDLKVGDSNVGDSG
jgi:hypothetical protein